MTLTGGESELLLDGVDFVAGNYPWIRLAIDEADAGHIELEDGSIHPLTIPSGGQSGLKLIQGITVTENGANNFIIDFDLRKSVTRSANGYKLRLTLRIIQVENEEEQTFTTTWTEQDMSVMCVPNGIRL